MSEKKITKQQAISQLWELGNLTYKMHSAQVDMYNKVKAGPDIIQVVACCRGWGKSYGLLLIAFEYCLKTPNTIVKYAAPTAKDLKSIVMENYKKIMEDCPKKFSSVIKWKVQENKIVFEHNGSEIHLAGVDKGNFEKLRGATADLAIVDEAGFCDKLDYIVKSVLFPTLVRGKGNVRNKRLIMASTPSKSNDHDFISYMRDYDIKEKLIKYTIDDNPLIPMQAKESGFGDNVKEYIDTVILSQYPNGELATAFQREYKCQIKTEEDDAIVPEFHNYELQQKIIKVWNKPAHYDAYVSMDIGFVDMTAVLFGYYDFNAAKLIICDELILSGSKMLIDNLATELRMKESANFTNSLTGETMRPYMRVADNNNPILVQDLSVRHGIHFTPTAKDNKDAAINNTRILIKSERIIIDPKCKTLIAHLKGAIWNKNRTAFARNSSDGSHYDACDAIIYLCRNINFSHNPFPQNSYSGNYHVNTQSVQPSNPFESFIQNAFTPKLNRRRRR